MLVSDDASLILLHWNRGAIKVRAEFNSGQLENRRGQIDVSCHGILNGASSYAWAAHEERNSNVLVKATFLSGGQSVLPEVEPVVGGVNDVSIVEQASLVELSDDLLDDLVDCLQCLKSSTIIIIDV